MEVKSRKEYEGLSVRGRRVILFQDMEELLRPLGAVVVRKLKQLGARARGVKEYDETLLLFRAERDPDAQYALMQRLEALDLEIEENSKALAFSSKVDQDAWVTACTFSDEWVCLEKNRGYIRAWFVCLHTQKNTVPPCAFLTSSKKWRRKHEQYDAKGQRYYCLSCGCLYSHNFGMLVEFMVGGTSTYLRAPVPSFDIEDVRAMYMESRLKPKASALELFRSLPPLMPDNCEGMLREARPDEMYEPGDPNVVYCRRITCMKTLEGLETFKWDSILAMFADLADSSVP